MVPFFIHRNSQIRFDLTDKETLMPNGWSPWFAAGALDGPDASGWIVDKDGSFKHTTSFAANGIPSVIGKGGLNSAYPSDFYISVVL